MIDGSRKGGVGKTLLDKALSESPLMFVLHPRLLDTIHSLVKTRVNKFRYFLPVKVCNILGEVSIIMGFHVYHNLNGNQRNKIDPTSILKQKSDSQELSNFIQRVTITSLKRI